jgi:membrane protease YdiL (CAAX protease family)
LSFTFLHNLAFVSCWCGVDITGSADVHYEHGQADGICSIFARLGWPFRLSVSFVMKNNVINLSVKEIKGLYSFLRRNYSEIIVVGLATLFLTLDNYHPIPPRWLGSLVYFAVLPLLTIFLLLRRNPLSFGLRLGNWRTWCFHVVVTFLIGLPVLYIASRYSLLESYYTIQQFDLLRYSLETIVYLFAWEFLFRGFLLFGLKEKLKESSILVQMIPFVLLHLAKPEVEAISTILVGIYLGYVVYRGDSYWPAFIIHLFINISFRVFVNLL